jgi:hypothetical protein
LTPIAGFACLLLFVGHVLAAMLLSMASYWHIQNRMFATSSPKHLHSPFCLQGPELLVMWFGESEANAHSLCIS